MSNSNIYSDEKCCLSSLHKMMATSHVGLLSTWNVTSVTEQLNFNLILISHIRPMAIIMEKHKIKKKNLPSSNFFFFLVVLGLHSVDFLLVASEGCSRHVGSVVIVHGALLLLGMWNLSGPGSEPMSPALASGFLFTAPPETSFLLNLS